MRTFARVMLFAALLVPLPRFVNATSVREFIDLTLSSSNNPRVVGFDEYSHFVRLGVYGSAWDCYIINSTPNFIGSNSSYGESGVAVVDAAGTPYVAFTALKTLSVQNPAQCSGVWSVDRQQLWLQKGTSSSNQVCIDSTGDLYGCVNFSVVGDHVTLARTSDGKIHAAYLAPYPGVLRFAVSNTAVTSFTPEDVAYASGGLGGGDVSLAIDSNGSPHIGFVNDGQYYYARKISGSWSVATLAVPAYSNGYSGRPITNLSLKLDGSNLASIVFSIGDTLWYARETSSMTFATAEIVDGSATGYPSLARDGSGNLHASYYYAGANVKYVQRSGGSWGTPVTAASHTNPPSSLIGVRQTIALTSGGAPRIAYAGQNPDGGDAAWLAELNGSTWSKSLVVPCYVPPPDTGGGGDHDPYHEGGLTYQMPGGEAPMLRLRASIVHGTTPLRFAITSTSPTMLRLSLYDISGRLRASRDEMLMQPGENQAEWSVGKMSSGIYFVRASLLGGPTHTFRVTVLP